jgi:hypothetical protein
MLEGTVLYDGSTRGFFANEDLLQKSGIIPPLAVRLSHAYMKKHPSSPCLLNAKEWTTALEKMDLK